jgi:hypothetical protein
MKQERNKNILYPILAIFLACLGFVFAIESQFKKIEQTPFIESSSKNWSHRGYAETEKKENTLASIDRAIQNGYEGVELDLWFKEGKFYLSHDENYADSLPKLKAVFRIFPEAYFWLDLKNLSFSNYEAIANQLEQLKKSKKTYLIESKNAFPLGLLHQKGFYTTYWITNGNSFRQFIKKCWIVYFGYNGISMPAKKYQKEGIRKKYKHLNIHLWDKHPNPKIYQWEEVKIVLDDNEVN